MKKVMIALKENKNLEGLVEAVKHHLINCENMEAQVLTTAEGVTIVQGRIRGGNFRQVVGLDKAVSVMMHPLSEGYVSVEIGNGKWLDKAVMATVSWFVLWPLAVTSTVGAVMQSRVLNRVESVVHSYALGNCQDVAV